MKYLLKLIDLVLRRKPNCVSVGKEHSEVCRVRMAGMDPLWLECGVCGTTDVDHPDEFTKYYNRH